MTVQNDKKMVESGEVEMWWRVVKWSGGGGGVEWRWRWSGVNRWGRVEGVEIKNDTEAFLQWGWFNI